MTIPNDIKAYKVKPRSIKDKGLRLANTHPIETKGICLDAIKNSSCLPYVEKELGIAGFCLDLEFCKDNLNNLYVLIQGRTEELNNFNHEDLEEISFGDIGKNAKFVGTCGSGSIRSCFTKFYDKESFFYEKHES